jgi:hypothetical protein
MKYILKSLVVPSVVDYDSLSRNCRCLTSHDNLTIICNDTRAHTHTHTHTHSMAVETSSHINMTVNKSRCSARGASVSLIRGCTDQLMLLMNQVYDRA